MLFGTGQVRFPRIWLDFGADQSIAQLIVLSKADQREDGAASVPDRMNKAAAAKVGASFVPRNLMREIRAKPGMRVLADG